MKRLSLCLLLTALFTSVALAQAEFDPQIVEDSLIMTKVPIRSGSTVDLHVKIWENVSPTCQAGFGNTILGIAGMAHTANTWRNLASAVLNTYQDKSWDGSLISGNVCRFVALDMPGHGRSSFPTGGSLKFGDLVIEDYVAAVFAGMDRLKAINVRPTILMGHSLGGLVVEVMQDTLIKQGKGASLRKNYGIRQVVLFAPAPPNGFSWSAISNPALIGLLSKYVFIDPTFGGYVLLDYPVWITLLFTGIDGKPTPSAPTAAQVMSMQYISPEPIGVLSQLASFPPLNRPSVAAGIFAPSRGTTLQTVLFENDPDVLLTEGQAVYRYLTYDDTKSRLIQVKGSEAVHDMHISDAALMLKKIKDAIDIPLVIGDPNAP